MSECYDDLRCFDYPVSRSVCSCVLDQPVIWQRAVVTHFEVCVNTLCRLCDVSDSWRPQLETQGICLLSGFRMRTYIWF